MRTSSGRLGRVLVLASFLLSLFAAVPCEAGITGYLIVHNTTSKTLSIYVNGDQFRGQVSPGGIARYLIGDSADGTTTFAAYDQSDRWVKDGSVAGHLTDFEWWVP